MYDTTLRDSARLNVGFDLYDSNFRRCCFFVFASSRFFFFYLFFFYYFFYFLFVVLGRSFRAARFKLLPNDTVRCNASPETLTIEAST